VPSTLSWHEIRHELCGSYAPAILKKDRRVRNRAITLARNNYLDVVTCKGDLKRIGTICGGNLVKAMLHKEIKFSTTAFAKLG